MDRKEGGSVPPSCFLLLAPDQREHLRDVCLASIGPVTSATLSKAGFAPTVEAREYTMGGLVEAIARFARESR